MTQFIHQDPSKDSVWRAIVLFGQNSACYKFALARTLIEVGRTGVSSISLNDLAPSFAEKICKHLSLADRQGTSRTSTPLKACRRFNAGDITKNQLTDTIAKHGFVNVIDAFHVLRDYQAGFRFFHDDRKGSSKGIILTDELHALVTQQDSEILDAEVDGRWRLVETAWELGVGSHHLEVDDASQDIFVSESHRRRSVTSVRQALNGYQKGQCYKQSSFR